MYEQTTTEALEEEYGHILDRELELDMLDFLWSIEEEE